MFIKTVKIFVHNWGSEQEKECREDTAPTFVGGAWLTHEVSTEGQTRSRDGEPLKSCKLWGEPFPGRGYWLSLGAGESAWAFGENQRAERATERGRSLNKDLDNEYLHFVQIFLGADGVSSTQITASGYLASALHICPQVLSLQLGTYPCVHLCDSKASNHTTTFMDGTSWGFQNWILLGERSC